MIVSHLSISFHSLRFTLSWASGGICFAYLRVAALTHDKPALKSKKKKKRSDENTHKTARTVTLKVKFHWANEFGAP